MDASHRGRSKTVSLSVILHATRFQHSTDIRNHILPHLGSKKLTQLKTSDLQKLYNPVSRVCARMQKWFLIFFHPSLEPFSERDGAVLCQFNPCVLLFQLMKLGHELALLFSKDCTIYRAAIFFMTCHNAPFPSAVFSFSNESVTIGTSFCHTVISFRRFFNTNNTTKNPTYPDQIERVINSDTQI